MLLLQIHADSGSPCNPRHISRSGLIARRSFDCLPWDTLTRCSHPSVRNCVILRRSFSTTRNRGSKGSHPFLTLLARLVPRQNLVRAGRSLHWPDRPNHGQQSCSCPLMEWISESGPLCNSASEYDRTKECVVLTFDGLDILGRHSSLPPGHQRRLVSLFHFSSIKTSGFSSHSHSFRYF